MKIISLQAENIKRLVAVEIRPDGNLVQITGKNGQGKTSVLDAIWWSMTGARNIQSAPIRKGADQAKIRLDMGEVIVTRTFKRDAEGEGFTTKLEVAGIVKGSPQAMLDSMLDSLAFDPLQFARMKPQEQFDALKKYVPDVDFDKIAGANSIDMANRKDINRKAKEERIIADQLHIPPNTPKEKIDESALVAALAAAGKHNADIRVMQQAKLREMELVQEKTATAEKLRLESVALTQRSQRLVSDAEAMLKEINSRPALADPVNVEELQSEIAKARLTNSDVARREHKEKLEKTAAKMEAEAKELTARMERREEEKRAKIAAAKIPVESITFGDGVVLLNGVPFDQGSDAEQLKASCALAMAGNPGLRVIRVRDGSLLDSEGLSVLGKMAQERDYQVWIERCSDGQDVGFVIEDGSLKSTVASHEQEQQGKLL